MRTRSALCDGGGNDVNEARGSNGKDKGRRAADAKQTKRWSRNEAIIKMRVRALQKTSKNACAR